MNPLEPCEKHDLAGCADCRPSPPRRVSPLQGLRSTAQYHGRCPACDEHISPGETIVLTDGSWLHEQCADS